MGALDFDFTNTEIEKQYDGSIWTPEIDILLKSHDIYYEVIDGIVCVKSKPVNHDIAKKIVCKELDNKIDALGFSCEAYTEFRVYQKYKGELSRNFVIPDVCILNDIATDTMDGFYCGTPRLAVEILSTNRNDDFQKKKNIYEEMGVLEYWMIDIESQFIGRYYLVDDKYLPKFEGYTDGVIQHSGCGLVMDVKELFEKINSKIIKEDDSLKVTSMFR